MNQDKIKVLWDNVLTENKKEEINAVADKKMWKEIKKSVTAEQKHHLKPYYWAAAILLLFLCIPFFFTHKKNQDLIAKNFVIKTNEVTKIYKLSDNTKITLKPHSVLTVNPGYGIKNREVALKGNAYFDVISNPALPFIVKTENFSTKVLGTQFIVDTQTRNKFFVQLIKGKVLVKSLKKEVLPMNDTYLITSQKLEYDFIKKQSQIINQDPDTSNKKIEVKPKPAILVNPQQPDYVFSNMPLTTVFTELEDKYHIIISFDDEKFESLMYSGKFKATDSVEVIMKKIGKDLGIEVTKKDRQSYEIK